jgi:broad specificity phosphatase PhoE
MRKIVLVFTVLLLVLTGCTKVFYIVRHAEKDTSQGADPNDPPLTPAGYNRAQVLATELNASRKVNRVFSTQRRRTDSTARPSARAANVTVQYYRNDTLQRFLDRVKAMRGGTLIVGHSNTIDDIANGLMGRTVVPADIDESVYDNLFIVYKKGRRKWFRAVKYGVATPAAGAQMQ